MRAKHLAGVAGVLGMGLVAAWPFRQEAPPRGGPPPNSQAIDLTLRRQDVTVVGSPPGDLSPATGMDAADDYDLIPVQPAAFSGVSRPSLEDLGPPPQMPIAFAPTELPPPQPFVPRQRSLSPGWLEKQSQPRQYKLRDGDTLEDLALRWLGSSSRAGEIFAANRAVLRQPDLLPVGQTITIPPKVNADDLE